MLKISLPLEIWLEYFVSLKSKKLDIKKIFSHYLFMKTRVAVEAQLLSMITQEFLNSEIHDNLLKTINSITHVYPWWGMDS